MKRKKLAKLTPMLLAGAMVLSVAPIYQAEAAETHNVITSNQAVSNQISGKYLANSKGYMVKKASDDQVNLPFSPELYYGRSLLTTDGGRAAWDYVVTELLAFNPAKNYEHYEILQNGHGKLTLNLKKQGIIAPATDVQKFSSYLLPSEARMFHLKGQQIKTDKEGNVDTISFTIASVYAGVDDYQNTLKEMEAFAPTILSVIDPRMTEAQKVVALYNKYASVMSYQWNANGTERGNIVGAFRHSKAICGGYSYGFQYLAMRAGIQSIYLTGQTEPGYHAWNNVKIDGDWYFLDSTWESNTWLLKGKSSLKSHNPRQSFATMPKLADNDYNLKDTIFTPDVVANQTFKLVTAKVKEVLNNYADQLSEINQVYMFEPTSLTFEGNEVENAISNEIREAVKGTFTGILSIDIANGGTYKTVDELIKNNLRIGFQASDDSTYYFYHNGKTEKYQ